MYYAEFGDDKGNSTRRTDECQVTAIFSAVTVTTGITPRALLIGIAALTLLEGNNLTNQEAHMISEWLKKAAIPQNVKATVDLCLFS